MKAENIQAVRNIPDKPLPQPLRQGDFVMSEVVRVEDGAALLRTAQGMLLSASLMGELGLIAGDHVETVVAEAGPGRYVLRLLDIVRGESAPPETGQTATAAPGLKPQTLYNTLNMLKMNAGLTPKAAEFMARNGIAATPENIGALAHLTGDGPRVAQALTQMTADTVLMMTGPESAADTGVPPIPAGGPETLPPGQGGSAAPGAAPQNAAAQAQAGVPATAAGAPDIPSAVLTIPTATPAVPSVMAETNGPGPLSPDGTGQNAAAATRLDVALQTDIPAFRPDTMSQIGIPIPRPDTASQTGIPIPRPDTASQTGIPAPRPDIPVQDGAQTFRAGGVPIPGNTEALRPAAPSFAPPPREADGVREPVALLQRLVSLFADLTDKETLPARLREAAHEVPVQLKELKHSLLNADSIERNTWSQQAELLDRQFTMMADIKRFDCYHVPLTTAHGAPSTAELYVYRQRRRKTEEAPDSYAVLIGLDTQHMGRVETMIRAQDRSVALEFRLEQASLAEAFEEGAKHLAPMIERAGYRLGEVSARPLAAKTTVLVAEEVLTEGYPADIGGMDIRV